MNIDGPLVLQLQAQPLAERQQKTRTDRRGTFDFGRLDTFAPKPSDRSSSGELFIRHPPNLTVRRRSGYEANSAMPAPIPGRRIPVDQRVHEKTAPLPGRFMDSGGDLLSHGLSPHYHRRYSVSLPGSEWDRVVPPCCDHQNSTHNMKWTGFRRRQFTTFPFSPC